MTNRLVNHICKQLSKVSSMSSIAEDTNVSLTNIMRILNYIHYTKSSLPEVLSIDKFKGNAETGKFQCIIVDGKKRKVLDILPDRSQKHLITYFKSFPRFQRYKVKFFICDMWNPYVELARIFFSNAKIIIDKYHLLDRLHGLLKDSITRLSSLKGFLMV